MLRRMLGTELPCELLPGGGLPVFGCPPLGTDVAVGVRRVSVCLELAEGVGDGVGAVVGVGACVGVGVTGVGVGVGVGVAVQLQETLTEFVGPVKVIVSFAGQGTVEGIVMFTATCPLG